MSERVDLYNIAAAAGDPSSASSSCGRQAACAASIERGAEAVVLASLLTLVVDMLVLVYFPVHV